MKILKQRSRFSLAVGFALMVSWCSAAETPRLVLEVFQCSNTTRQGLINWNESHAFVLFSDGVVIWRSKWKESLEEYYISQVEDVQRYREYGATLIKLGANGPVRASNWSDGPTTVIRFEGHEAEFYGNWETPPKIETSEDASSELEKLAFDKDLEVWKKFPADARKILTMLKNFTSEKKTPWRPTVRAIEKK